MVAHGNRRSLANAFAGAASSYCLEVAPQVGREVRLWEARADRIPDALLRRHALLTQRKERGNLEGAAAFAVLAPRSQRARVVRATVAFQAAYDYVDTLAEQPSEDPIANGRQLHLALLSALAPGCRHPDYYAHRGGGRDAGYIHGLIEACRSALAGLPSYRAVRASVALAARRMVAYQSLNHPAPGQAPVALAGWAGSATPPGSGLLWWETAAACASSLGVLALIAAAGRPRLRTSEVAHTELAYFPWVGALHVLLDSLVDRDADAAGGQHNLVEHYRTPAQAAVRLAAIAGQAQGCAQALPDAAGHELMLAAMCSFYLSAPGAATAAAAPAARAVLDQIGGLATPAMTVQRVRRGRRRITRNSSIGLSSC